MIKYFFPIIGIFYLIELYNSDEISLLIFDMLILATFYHGIMWFTLITFIITHLKF